MRFLTNHTRLSGIKTFPNILKDILKASLTLALLAIICVFGHVTFQGREDASAGSQVSSAGQAHSHPISFLNDRARDITGATAVNAPGFVVPAGLTGQGQIVAIADSGLDAGSIEDIHPDLRSEPGKMPKVVLLKSWAGRSVPNDPDGHGTHMAATIAGAGAASNGKFRGVAPEASIYFQAILDSEGNPAPPANLTDLFYPAYSAGARVHVNGWGGGSDTYLGYTAQVDDFARSHPDFLAIFGAGNSGPAAGTITAEANSKNALTVGASILPRPAFVPGEVDTTAPASFSSRGPTGDGRVKPELLAPASAVISAKSRLVEGNLPGYPEYTQMQGTSMAAAVAGGSAALIREYLKKYMDMSTPSAALIKAALINGARPSMGGPSQEGFGVVDLAGTVIALKDKTFSLADEWAGVSQGEEITYAFHVSDTSAPFKATLAWTDPPAEPGAAKTLVNDLDLIVKTPDGRVYYGNHFLGANAPDRKNNVEQVYLSAPVPGDYTVTVKGAAVRRNTVQGAGAPLQDFALVWGRPPTGDTVAQANDQSIKLNGGALLNLEGQPATNLINDSVSPADGAHIYPGAAVYRTPLRVYLSARQWRAVGVKAIMTTAGTVFTEINPAARLGGYTPAKDAGTLMFNGSPANSGELPPGLEINAVINPLDQQIRQIRASCIECEGVVSAVKNNGGRKEIILAESGKAFRVSDDAVYSYEDSYTGIETTDMPFGTGALDELAEVLPGMPVRLRLAPSSGEVQYLAVKRWVVLGTVRKINNGSEISLENGDFLKIMPGAQVIRNKEVSSLDRVKAGDYVTAVILPDTREAIGLVAFSDIVYGKAIEFSKKSGALYLLDDNGSYRQLYLPADTIVCRWGVRAATDTITAGSRVRVITDAAGGEAWRLDVADTFFSRDTLENYDGTKGLMTMKSDQQYRFSATTRVYKNGYPAMLEDFLPGEQVELEYASAPPPTGNVLLTVNARSGAASPLLLASAVTLGERLVICGRTAAGADVYICGEEGARRAVSVDTGGRFRFSLPLGDMERYGITLTSVDRRTKGLTGRTLTLPADSGAGEIINEVIGKSRPGALKDGASPGDLPLTRVEAVTVLALWLHWPGAGAGGLSFADLADIQAAFRPAVAEAVSRGIVRGYPGGGFQPMAVLARIEAAAMFTAVLQDLGFDTESNMALTFTDTDEVPVWALEAVGGAAAAGFFDSRAIGAFGPAEPVTAGEMKMLLERLQDYLVSGWADLE